jgi:ketosteroid isomerase-like protein
VVGEATGKRAGVTLTIAVALTALVLGGCSRSVSPGPSVDEDLVAIAKFNERYLGAINTGDIATLSRLTTEEHVMLAPNRAPIVGKAANDAVNGAAFERFDFDESWNPEETILAGDWAYQRGTFTTAATPKAGGDKRVVSGAYLRIYRRQPDGEWRMIRDMFNSDGRQAN